MKSVPKKQKPNITKAVVAVAGSGTRFLPVTKTMLKEMLPIVDRDNELWIVDAIREYVQGGGVFLAKEVEDGGWLTTGDPLNHL